MLTPQCSPLGMQRMLGVMDKSTFWSISTGGLSVNLLQVVEVMSVQGSEATAIQINGEAEGCSAVIRVLAFHAHGSWFNPQYHFFFIFKMKTCYFYF